MEPGGDDAESPTGILRVADRLAVGAIRRAILGYQRLLSPMLGRNCRFQPTCSEYFRQAVEKHGALRGTCRGIGRICRCHPWSRGGWDPP